MAQDTAGRSDVGQRIWVISALLVSLTLTVAAVSVVVLSSTLTQTRLSAISVDGVSISIWKLNSIGREWAAIRHLIRDQSNDLGRAQRQRIEVTARYTGAQENFAAQETDLKQMLEEFYHRIKGVDPQLAALIENKPYPAQLGHIRGAKEALHAAHPEVDAAIAAIEAAGVALAKSERDRDAAGLDKKVVEQKIKDLTSGIDQDTKALDTVFNLVKPNLDSASRARIENALYELYFEPGITSRVMRHFITTETDILTLSLVILMGVLGSALQMTYAYFIKNQAVSLGAYVLRLSVGAITALVIFIVAKAGVPVIADASRFGGEAPINPYLVSFLAIISGLLSENAIASVQAQGAKFFGTGTDGPDRWMRTDLSGELQAQKLSLSDLAHYLGISEDTAAGKIKGDDKIEPAEQKVIAIYLRRSPRDIFTDIPPPAANNAPTSAAPSSAAPT